MRRAMKRLYPFLIMLFATHALAQGPPVPLRVGVIRVTAVPSPVGCTYAVSPIQIVEGTGTHYVCVEDGGGAGVDEYAAVGGGGGDMSADDMWVAKGDLAVADAVDSAIILTAGTNDYMLMAASGAASGAGSGSTSRNSGASSSTR